MTNYSGVSVPCLPSPAFCFSAEISQHLHLQHLGPPVNSETDTIIAVYTHTHTHTLPVVNFIVFSLCLFSNRTSDRCTKICSWFIALHTIFFFFSFLASNSTLSTVVRRCNERKKTNQNKHVTKQKLKADDIFHSAELSESRRELLHAAAAAASVELRLINKKKKRTSLSTAGQKELFV